MNNSKLISLYEHSIILNEYSEGFLKAQTQRLAKQAGRYIREEVIVARIKRFDQLKNGPSKERITQIVREAIEEGRKPLGEQQPGAINPELSQEDLGNIEIIKNTPREELQPAHKAALQFYNKEKERIEKLYKNPLQIEFYSWKNLELVVHQFLDPSEKEAIKKIQTSDTNTSIVYDENNLQIFHGANEGECYILRNFVIKNRKDDKPKIPSWCTSVEPNSPGQHFWDYRSGSFGEVQKSAYFVADYDRNVKDKWWFFVIHVPAPESEPSKTKDGKYMVTSFDNREGYNWITWDEIVKLQPKLQGLEHLFQFVPFSEDEQIRQLLTGNANPDTFKTYTNYNVKRQYIRTGKVIYSEDYAKLDAILQHTYINQRAPNQEDKNYMKMLEKLVYIFADPGYKVKARERVYKTLELMKKLGKNSPAAVEPLLDEPTIKNSRKENTYKHWCNYLLDVARGSGKAATAIKQSQNAGNV